MATSFKMLGGPEMRAKLKRIMTEFPGSVERALREETEIEATESKRRTPVDTGALRASIHVEGPERSGRSISSAIVAGGSSTSYAAAVHEDLEAFHPVGQAKYIESVLMESAPHMAGRIGKRIELKG